MLNEMELVFLKHVVQTNDITRNGYSLNSKYHLDSRQRLIIVFLLAQITAEQTEFKEERISIREFAQIFGFSYSGGEQRISIKKSLEEMIHTGFWMCDEITDRDKYIQWVEDVEIDWKKEVIALKLHHNLSSYLLGAKNNVTRYQMGCVSMFRGKYTWSLYEFLCSYKEEKTCKLSMDKMIQRFGFSIYSRWPDIKRRVLESSVKEINKTSDLYIEYKSILRGHCISEVVFKIIKKENSGLSMEQHWEQLLRKTKENCNTSDTMKER